LHTELATLDFDAGMHDEAARHARIAMPLLEQLHAHDDAMNMRASLALTALHDGDVDEAERLLAEAGDTAYSEVPGGMVRQQVRAELQLAKGDVDGGLASFLAVVDAMGAVRFAGVETTGLEPWVVVVLGTALTAHVRHGVTDSHRRRAAELADRALAVARTLLSGPEAAIDYPVVGTAMAGLAAWQLTERRDDAESVAAGVRLLALAAAFGYNRWFPVMAWDPLAAYAEAAAPGRLAALGGEYDGRRGRELREDALQVVEGLTSSG
jgi:hypothetical protein